VAVVEAVAVAAEVAVIAEVAAMQGPTQVLEAAAVSTAAIPARAVAGATMRETEEPAPR